MDQLKNTWTWEVRKIAQNVATSAAHTQYINCQNALDALQDHVLQELLNKEADLTREFNKG